MALEERIRNEFVMACDKCGAPSKSCPTKREAAHAAYEEDDYIIKYHWNGLEWVLTVLCPDCQDVADIAFGLIG